MDKNGLLRIAWKFAKQEAAQYVEQERDREKSLSFDFVIITMVGHIGQALFDAGHDYDSLTFEERHLIATLALLDAGYMDL